MKKNILSSSVSKQIVSLIFVQGLNYIIPMLLIPFVTRALGPAGYGLITFSQSFVLYFTLLINYSFDLTATKEIVRAKGNYNQETKIFSRVIVTKAILFLVSASVFLIFLFVSPTFNAHILLHSISFLVNFGFVIYPIWLFQAKGAMRQLVIINIFSKIFLAVLTFVFISRSSDYLLYNLFFTCSQLFLGVVSFIYVITKYKLKISFVPIRIIYLKLKDGFFVFLSVIAINLYAITSTVILGLFATSTVTGYYSSASKITSVIIMVMLFPLSSILYPKTTAAFVVSREEGIAMLQKSIWITFIISLVIGLILLIFAKPIILLLFGNEFSPAIQSLMILSFLPMLVGLTNAFAIQGLLNFDLKKQFLTISLAAVIICIVFNLVLVPFYGQIGACVSWLVSDLFVASASFYLLKKEIKLVFNPSILNYIFKHSI